MTIITKFRNITININPTLVAKEREREAKDQKFGVEYIVLAAFGPTSVN